MNKRALCVGINNYPGTDNDLHGCVNDAHDWQQALLDRGFSVDTLTDSKATKKALVTSLEAKISSAQPGDILVFTYSGHGTWVPDTNGDEVDGRDEALVTYDIGSQGPLLDDTLSELFAGAQRGVRLIFISDSCHSGSVSRFLGKHEPLEPRVKFLPPAHFLPSTLLTHARSIERATVRGRARQTALTMSGCQDSEFSFDASYKGRPNGAFTRSALDALAKLSVDATYGDWQKAIRKLLPSAQYPQRPQITATDTQRAWKIFG